MLTLNERTFLCDFLVAKVGGYSNKYWKLSEKINRKERGLLLALCYQNNKEKLTEVLADMSILHGVK